MRLFAAPLILLTTFLQSSFADQFLNPSNSKTDLTEQYVVGQVVQLSWQTSLSDITLTVSHWGGSVVGALLSDAGNPNVYTWTIGQNDNINNALVASSSNYVLVISDPSGSNLNGNGFVNGQLQSRAFVIKANSSSSSSSSSSRATSSVIQGTTSTIPASTSATSVVQGNTSTIPASKSVTSTFAQASPSNAAQNSSTIAAPASTSTAGSGGLSTGAKAGIGAGAGVGALILVGAGAMLAICVSRKRRRDSGEHGLNQNHLPPAPPPAKNDGVYEVHNKSVDNRGAGKKHLYGYSSYDQSAVQSSYIPPSEMEQPGPKPEMQSTVHELDGGRNSAGRWAR